MAIMVLVLGIFLSLVLVTVQGHGVATDAVNGAKGLESADHS